MSSTILSDAKADSPHLNPKQGIQVTPLAVIAAFIGLVETVIFYAVTRTTGHPQTALLVFAIALTCAVVAGFFALIWKRPVNIWPPDIYSIPASIEQYAEATLSKKSRQIEDVHQKKILSANPPAPHTDTMKQNLSDLRSDEIQNEFWRVIVNSVAGHLHRRPTGRDNRDSLVHAIKHLFQGDEAISSTLIDLLLKAGMLESPTPDRFMLSEQGNRMIRSDV